MATWAPLSAASLVLLLTACRSAPDRGLPRATALEERGEALLAEGHAAEAKEVFLQAGPTRSYLAAIGLARAALALRDDRLFEATMTATLPGIPVTAESFDLAGRTMLLGARSSRGRETARQRALLATGLFEQAHRLGPDVPRLTYHLGVAQLTAGHPEVALPLLESAHAEDRGSVETLQALVSLLWIYDRPARIREILDPIEKSGRLPPDLAADLARARTAAPGRPAPAPANVQGPAP